MGSGNLTVNVVQTRHHGHASTFAGTITGSGNFAVTGTGSLSLNNSGNDWSGTTTINKSNNSSLKLLSENSIPTDAELTIGTGRLWLAPGVAQTIAKLTSSSSNARIVLSKIDSSSTLSSLTINQSADTTFAGIILGHGKIIKSGTGDLTLSGANTYIGGTVINAGSVILGAAGVLADTGHVQLANTSGAILNLNGNNETIGALTGGGTTGGNIVLGSGNLIINNVSTRHSGLKGSTYTGVISGSGSVTKIGGGTLQLANANTYTGGTTINVGKIILKANNALASARAVTIANSGKLIVAKDITQTIGAFTGGSNTTLWIRGGATLNVNQSTDTTMAGTIFGFGSGSNKGKLRKTGSGTLTISGSNNISVEDF
jgi:autotransporter-associated beta strand protein